MEIRLNGSGGIKLAVDVAGDPGDPCVLLLPGFGQTRAAWSKVAKALAAAGRYAVSVDLRGHGDSDWAPSACYELGDIIKDVKAILEQLPGKPAVVGTSLGALAALAAIGESTQPIASALILIDALPRMNPTGLDRHAALMTRDASGFASLDEAATVLADFLPGNERLDGNELKQLLRRSDSGRFRWHVDPAYNGFDVGPEGRAAAYNRFNVAASALEVPTLLIRNSASTVLDQAGIDAFLERVPQAEVVDINAVGDLVIGRRNDAFDIAVLDFLERVNPRPGARPQGGIEPRMLRDALGCFVTGVTVITTSNEDGTPLGFTANSFTSVSLDPPLVLFCIKRQSPSVDALRKRGAFAVNVLHIGQQPVSARFASRNLDRFAETEWETWEQNVPIILDAAANFECIITEIADGGDHVIVIGRVSRVHFDPSRDPLLYFQGAYRRMHVTRNE
jgi:flavin reductase (DIM6/NTAB) family NADH-FMN oxidoreductase RutF/pimeloyl-ACP methyl ester carboxylesterase